MILVCRDRDKAQHVARELRARTGNEAVDILIGDLSRQRQIYAIAAEFSRNHDRLDVLINNAGRCFHADAFGFRTEFEVRPATECCASAASGSYRSVASQSRHRYQFDVADGPGEGSMFAKSVISTFSAEQVARITGLTLRQLAYWDNVGFFKPSLTQIEEGAKPFRVYSFNDIVGLRVISVLRQDHKISIEQLRKVARRIVHLYQDSLV